MIEGAKGQEEKGCYGRARSKIINRQSLFLNQKRKKAVLKFVLDIESVWAQLFGIQYLASDNLDIRVSFDKIAHKFCGLVELGFYRSNGDLQPGGYFPVGISF